MTDTEGLREAVETLVEAMGDTGFWGRVSFYLGPNARTAVDDRPYKRVKAAYDDMLAALRDTGPRPDSGIDPRVVEAFDMLGAMWSWSEDNGYFATGSGAVLAAGRLLKEVVGRPAQPPARLSTPRTETNDD